MSPETAGSGSPARRSPLASGLTFGGIGVVLSAVRLLVHSPAPDIAASAVPQRVASLRASASATRDGVHIELPSQWSFGRNLRSAHSPRDRVTVPGLGQVTVGVKRTVVFGATRSVNNCAVILERAKADQSVDEDIAAIRRTVSQSVYKLNVFSWVSGGPSWFALLIDAADDILNEPGPSTRLIEFKPLGETTASIGRLPARQIAFTANVDGKEKDALMFAFARQYQWQYALITVLGEQPRQCAAEAGWIRSRLSFE